TASDRQGIEKASPPSAVTHDSPPTLPCSELVNERCWRWGEDVWQRFQNHHIVICRDEWRSVVEHKDSVMDERQRQMVVEPASRPGAPCTLVRTERRAEEQGGNRRAHKGNESTQSFDAGQYLTMTRVAKGAIATIRRAQ